jgi:hypothetical protein
MRVSCVVCKVHRDSAVEGCGVCGALGVLPVECSRSCCDPLASVRKLTAEVGISVAALDVIESTALLIARTDLSLDDSRRLAGRVLDALRVERSVGRCTPVDVVTGRSAFTAEGSRA